MTRHRDMDEDDRSCLGCAVCDEYSVNQSWTPDHEVVAALAIERFWTQVAIAFLIGFAFDRRGKPIADVDFRMLLEGHISYSLYMEPAWGWRAIVGSWT